MASDYQLCYTPEGLPFYYSAASGQSLWATSEDWILQYDPSGRAIYYNSVTQESQWAEVPDSYSVGGWGRPISTHQRPASLNDSHTTYHSRGGSSHRYGIDTEGLSAGSGHGRRGSRLPQAEAAARTTTSKADRRLRAERNLREVRKYGIGEAHSGFEFGDAAAQESESGLPWTDNEARPARRISRDSSVRGGSGASGQKRPQKAAAAQRFVHDNIGASNSSDSGSDSDSNTDDGAEEEEEEEMSVFAEAAQLLFGRQAGSGGGGKRNNKGKGKRGSRSAAGGSPLTISRALAPAGNNGTTTIGNRSVNYSGRDIESDVDVAAVLGAGGSDPDGLKRAEVFVGMSLQQRTEWLRSLLLKFGSDVVTQAQVVALFLSTSSLPLLATFLSAAARGTADALRVVEQVVRTASSKLSPRSELPLPVLTMQARARRSSSAYPSEYLPEDSRQSSDFVSPSTAVAANEADVTAASIANKDDDDEGVPAMRLLTGPIEGVMTLLGGAGSGSGEVALQQRGCGRQKGGGQRSSAGRKGTPRHANGAAKDSVVLSSGYTGGDGDDDDHAGYSSAVSPSTLSGIAGPLRQLLPDPSFLSTAMAAAVCAASAVTSAVVGGGAGVNGTTADVSGEGPASATTAPPTVVPWTTVRYITTTTTATGHKHRVAQQQQMMIVAGPVISDDGLVTSAAAVSTVTLPAQPPGSGGSANSPVHNSRTDNVMVESSSPSDISGALFHPQLVASLLRYPAATASNDAVASADKQNDSQCFSSPSSSSPPEACEEASKHETAIKPDRVIVTRQPSLVDIPLSTPPTAQPTNTGASARVGTGRKTVEQLLREATSVEAAALATISASASFNSSSGNSSSDAKSTDPQQMAQPSAPASGSGSAGSSASDVSPQLDALHLGQGEEEEEEEASNDSAAASEGWMADGKGEQWHGIDREENPQTMHRAAAAAAANMAPVVDFAVLSTSALSHELPAGGGR